LKKGHSQCGLNSIDYAFSFVRLLISLDGHT
jgi:hypothetical protein